MSRAREHDVDRGRQADDRTVLLEQRHIRRVLDRAAARRNHESAALGRAPDRLPFQCAESRLALRGEDLGNRAPRLFLDHAVEIDEGAAETLRKRTSRARLARAHEADQYDVLHLTPPPCASCMLRHPLSCRAYYRCQTSR